MNALLSKYYTKSIRLSSDGFSLFDTDENGTLHRQDFQNGENVLLSAEAQKFFRLENSNDPLDIIVATHVPMLIPEIIYDDGKAKDYLSIQHDITHYGQHYSDRIGLYRALYFLTQNEHTTISSLPCQLRTVSEMTLFCQFLQEHNHPESMLVSVNDRFVDFLAMHDNQPSFVNRTFHTEAVDVLYYSMNSIQQFGFREPEIIVNYFCAPDKKLNELLQKYHQQVTIL
jgi:hypothetical protein